MIAALANLGALACLLASGVYGSRLAVRDLRAGQPLPVGWSYRIYLLLPLVYGLLVARRDGSNVDV